MLILICILSWITVSLFVVGLAMKGERALVRDRVESLRLSIEEDVEMVVPELTQPFSERVVRPALHNTAVFFSRLLPTASGAVATKLENAGRPWNLQPVEFAGLKVILMFVFAALAIAASVLMDLMLGYQIAMVACGVIIGYAIPESMLESAVRNRHSAIRKSLANCIDLLVVSTEAGLGFDGALAKVVDKVSGPLADEFRRVLDDMSIGRSRMEALKAMSDRVGLPELTTFVAAVRQADLLGTSIAHVLRVQADSLRVQRNIRARETAAKLPVKMLFPLVFFIFPAVFVVVLGPGFISILRALGD